MAVPSQIGYVQAGHRIMILKGFQRSLYFQLMHNRELQLLADPHAIESPREH